MSISNLSAWYRIELSPHEWTWTQDEQVEMASHIRKLHHQINAYQKVVNAAKKAIANTPHTTECTYYKNVGIDCNCWQREVAEAIDRIEVKNVE